MMEASHFFVAVIMALATAKDGVLSCTIQSHKISSPPCTSSLSDPTSDPHHTSAPCRSSHGKHRDPLNKNAGHSLDSTLMPHHKFISRPHAIPPISPCDSSSGSSSCLPKVLLGLPNGSVSPKPFFIPATPTSDSTSVLPATPFGPSGYNPDLLKYLMKICLSSPACNNSSKPQIPSESQNVLSTSNSTPTPVRGPKPHTIPCISSPGSSNILPNMPCGSTSSLLVTPNQKLLLPVTVFPSDVTPDLKKFLHNLFSLAPLFPALPGCKSTPSSPLCPTIRPALNKDAVPVPVSKPHSTSNPNHPFAGPNSCSSSTPPGLPCVSSSPSNITVPKSDSETAPAQTFKVGPDHVPEEFPESAPAPVPSPGLETGHVQLQSSTAHNSTPIRNSPNLLLPPQFNITSIPIQKAQVLIPPLGIPLASKSCVSSNSQQKNSNDSHLPNNITFVSVKHPLFPFSVPPVPSLSPGVSSGYNTAYMDHLIKYLLSTSPGVPPFSSLTQNSQPLTNVTPVSPPSPNPLSASNNYNEKLSELKPPNVSLLNTSSTNLTLTSTINPNIKNTTNIPNDPILINIVCKLLFSTLIASKTPFHPCLPPQMSPLNTNSVSPIVPNPLPPSLPFQSTFDSLFDLLNIVPNPISSSNKSSPSIPLPPPTPLPIQKPLLEPLQSKIPSTLTPTPLLGCHHKHLRPQQPGVNPCLHKAIRPHTPSPPLPCLQSKLNSGCKLLS